MTQVKELKDVVYGPYERNVLDAYLVGSKENPSPAVLFMHGGGYLHGDKETNLSGVLKKECLDNGISVISANYRFISTDPYPAPMQDGTRAIQFVRHMAEEWGIDPDKIATSGGSAGGHILLWNALKGDSSNTDSSDPVERESSAVSAFVGFATQASKDQRFYHGIYEGPHIQPNLVLFYGMDSIDDLNKPEFLKLAEEASAITYLSEKAPPLLLNYDYPLDDELCIPQDAPVGEVIHHPMHGYVLKQRYDALGKKLVLRHKNDPLQPGEVARFLQEVFA